MAAITTRAGKGTPLSNNEIDDNVLFHDTKGADIASAGTVNLDTATGRWLHITGTTNITAFTLGAGRERTVVFDGILTLTHNASSLICPTGANITTAAGDTARLFAETANNVRVINYTRKNGKALAETATGTNTGDETTTTVGALINGATGKTTPVDADYLGLMDSAASNILKKLSWANLKATFIGTVLTWTAAQRGAYSALTDGATITPDLSLANNYSVVLGGNRTLGVPTNAVAGQTGQISVKQDATGTRTLAYAWPYVWPGGTAGVLSTAGCSLDQLIYDVETYTSSNVTITIATPGVVSWTAHGLKDGQRIQLTTTGALPTGLTASTTYYVTNASTDAFNLSTTLANAAAGTKIATSGSQSGTHTMVAATIKMALNKAYA